MAYFNLQLASVVEAKPFVVRKFSLLLLALLMAIAGCEDREREKPVTGPAYCKNFDTEVVERQAMNGNVDAMRQMRDYCFDCRVTPDGAEILRWAEMAANHGDESDMKALNDIRETFSM